MKKVASKGNTTIVCGRESRICNFALWNNYTLLQQESMRMPLQHDANASQCNEINTDPNFQQTKINAIRIRLDPVSTINVWETQSHS
jgi:hypothetical protein